MSLYNLKTLAADTFMIAKFSDDFEVESCYTLVRKGFSYTCDCPANNRPVVTKPCRHKLMMPTLLPAVDTDRFYDFDTQKFSTPLGDLFRPEAGELEGREALPDPVEALSKLVGFEITDDSVRPTGEAVPSPSVPDQRAHNQSLAGTIECGAVKIVQGSAPASQPTIIRRR